MTSSSEYQCLENESEDFNAEIFVQRLLDEGSKIPCDKTQDAFNNQNKLPEYYDEALYKRGQQFYHDNIFACFFGKLNGLLAILASPKSLKILQFTKNSSSALTAYRRYLSTIFHMTIWYEGDFTPGSRLWRSISKVRSKHNNASQRSCVAGLDKITQKHMAVTQFGFLGFILIRSEMVGIHNPSEDDLVAIIHVWRVIGHILGMEEKFNICRKSVKETKQICNLLLDKVLKPQIIEKDENFLEMARYLLEGMWCMNPYISYKPCMSYTHYLVVNDGNNTRNIPTYFELNAREKRRLNMFFFFMKVLKYSFVRIFLNYVMYMTFFLMRTFPFLAIYKFGMTQAYVDMSF